MEIPFRESDTLENDMFMEPADDLQDYLKQKTTWSMEILPHNINDVSLIPEFVNEVYITMIPGASCWETIQTAQQIKAVGKQAIPHIAARSFADVEELSACLSELQEAGIERALLIGGGNSEPAGDFSCVMDMLKTGLLTKYGINSYDFAGHP
ncbi:MAG TPA: hypothetical protein EYN57_05810, partial [Candidatus Lambdaproteobacteria bacterium]|nr:hypothetical protein [Candidatus Lambdaproteobacteria bacterium]